MTELYSALARDYSVPTLNLALELGSEFDWYTFPKNNRLSILGKRQSINYYNYSAGQAALVAASVNNSKTQWKVSDFLPFPGVWSYFSGERLNISSDTALEMLATMDDCPISCYMILEDMRGQLETIATLF